MASRTAVIKTAVVSDRFELIGEAGLDDRKRVSLTKAIDKVKEILGSGEGVRFSIYTNEAGQILLSPEISVPAHEAWLYRNPRALARVVKGMAELSDPGELKDLGSFTKFAHQISDDEIE